MASFPKNVMNLVKRMAFLTKSAAHLVNGKRRRPGKPLPKGTPIENCCIKYLLKEKIKDMKKESRLHYALKTRYSGEGGKTEVATGDYVCDGVTQNGELIEVQTGSFKPLEEKIKRLAESNRIRIIHPIIITKYLERRDADGSLLAKRKSPRKGTIWDLFKALVYAPEVALLRNVTIELALVDVTEQRVADGRGSWRRKGVSIHERQLAAYHESLALSGREAYSRFAPFDADELFTAQDLADKAGVSAALARKTLYVLMKLGTVERRGKRGRAWLYQKNEEPSFKEKVPQSV
jgi:hypothetical protein